MVLGLGYPLSAVFVYSLWVRKSAVEKNHLIIFVLIFFITTSVNYSFLPDILSLFTKIQFSWRLTPFVVLLVLLEISRNDKIGVNAIASILLTTALISTVMTITLYQTKRIDLNKTEPFATVGYTDYVLADAVKYKDHLAPKHLLCNTGEKIHSVAYTKTIESNGLPLYTFDLPEAGECLIPFLAYNPLYLSNVSDYRRDGFFQATLSQGQHQVAVKLKPIFRYLLYATMLLSLATALLLYRHNRR